MLPLFALGFKWCLILPAPQALASLASATRLCCLRVLAEPASDLSSLLAVSEVVEPELMPLELWRTRLLLRWGTLARLPSPRRLALSRQRLEARMEARTLCLLPRRTEIKERRKKGFFKINLGVKMTKYVKQCFHFKLTL